MAKMHTKRKGKSCSKKPIKTVVPEWCNQNQEEITKLVLEFWKQGISTSQIGIILRDQYGIGNIKLITKKTITQILKENNVYTRVPEDLTNLIMKTIKLRKHLSNNKKDIHNKRSLQLTESKVRRLVKYYHNKKILPNDWIYKPETAEVMLTR